MPDVHPSHIGLPTLYGAEVSGFRGRWALNVVAPGPETVAGPTDLGPIDAFVVAHPDDPGRFLIAIDGEEVPALPRKAAVRALEEHGFVIAADAHNDAKTDHGWTQLATALWTAPCQPASRS
ncbi:hypothetical protein [Streptomyces sp. CBMA123]|uniref:hypothetical protein n=1 Tax=Streptomyces sp. CBMA123 TaxID=1896313 RepID=UPI0016619131|nr:hypothetical protein [Streptomyces sp. CBMA123]